MLIEYSSEIIDLVTSLFFLLLLGGGLDFSKSSSGIKQSEQQKLFQESIANLLLTEDQTGAGTQGIFAEAFKPGARANIFKSVGADVRTGFQRERKGIKKRFAQEEERGLRLFEEELLPAIRERAGAAGRGKSTGTAIGGIRAGESLLEQLAIGRQSALTESQTRQTDFFQSLDLLGASSEVGLLETILGIGTGLGRPQGVGTSSIGGGFTLPKP